MIPQAEFSRLLLTPHCRPHCLLIKVVVIRTWDLRRVNDYKVMRNENMMDSIAAPKHNVRYRLLLYYRWNEMLTLIWKCLTEMIFGSQVLM
ncbi:hypothetical protein QCA50_021053 [Cerrena zonata]|uniref:Uncharacterized protein n=1 Tax=Cerrena zonata TaxID=2478898 RepID=A0AAW0F8L4_9APHY